MKSKFENHLQPKFLAQPAFSLLRPRSSNRLEAAEAEAEEAEAEAEEDKVLKALSSSLFIALS